MAHIRQVSAAVTFAKIRKRRDIENSAKLSQVAQKQKFLPLEPTFFSILHKVRSTAVFLESFLKFSLYLLFFTPQRKKYLSLLKK